MNTRMRNVMLGAVILVILLTVGVGYTKADFTYINKPGASRTYPNGVDGDIIAGNYDGANGFIYKISDGSWTDFKFEGNSTNPNRIDDGHIVGNYYESGFKGFFYDMETGYGITFDYGYETNALANDGDYVVGYYGTSGNYQGFVYEIGTNNMSILNTPSGSTYLTGIDTNTGTCGIIVAYGYVSGGFKSWLYDMSTDEWTPFYGPNGEVYIALLNIDDSLIIGHYVDGVGKRQYFLYDMVTDTWRLIDGVDGAVGTYFADVSKGQQGNDGTIVTGYYDAPGSPGHGFIYTFNQPPVAMCQEVLVAVGTDGYTNASVDGGSYDPDGDGISFSQVPEGPYPVGVYNVELTVTDPLGASDSCQAILVVYDPSRGFVTGGGWIWSPKGAYVADPWLEGKANFGFVSKYKKGASEPTGQTEFVFQAGDLNFHSSSYDWMVVAGAKAMFKGVGTINGAGNYGSMLSAVDAALTPSTSEDRFRIKIWDKNADDAVVYDNQIGDDDNADVTTAISGGSIVIHTK